MTRILLLFAIAAGTSAFARNNVGNKVDLAVTYTAERANVTGTCGCFWLQGGGIEAGANLWRGLGVAGSFTGTHNGSLGPQGVALSLITATFGPRYRYRLTGKPMSAVKINDASVFGEGLFGTAHGFDSVFPGTNGLHASSSAFATQLGGGIDVGLSPHFAIRPIALSWVRTRLPNSANNTQNELRVGFGLVVRFGKEH